MATGAFSGAKVVLKSGDGGVGAGTQASRTIGTSDQTIVIKARQAGAAGNSKTCSIVVSGNNTVFSFSVSASNLVITSATDGGGAATTTVGQAISALYEDATFVKHWQATVGGGDGSGVLVEGASAALTGGADGPEVFAAIAEVRSVSGPNMSSQVIDVTNMDSANNTREFISSWIDPGELTFAINHLPTNTNQQQLVTDMINSLRRNYRLEWTDASGVVTACNMAGLVTGFGITNVIDDAVQSNVTIKLTGFPTWF